MYWVMWAIVISAGLKNWANCNLLKYMAKKILVKEIKELKQACYLHERLEDKLRNEILVHKLRIRDLEDKLKEERLSQINNAS